jgi:hypothetical protein
MKQVYATILALVWTINCPSILYCFLVTVLLLALIWYQAELKLCALFCRFDLAAQLLHGQPRSAAAV